MSPLFVDKSEKCLPSCRGDEIGANDPCSKARKSTIPHTAATMTRNTCHCTRG